MKEFLIISDDISRRQNLLTILGFIGENCQALNYGKALEAFRVVMKLRAFSLTQQIAHSRLMYLKNFHFAHSYY